MRISHEDDATIALLHARQDPVESVVPFDLKALDAFLKSDRVPDEAMMLSDLDGFLTGIVVGPELVPSSEWLPLVWGGEAEPDFASEHEAKAIIGAITARYSEIALQIADGTLDPIFWEDCDGSVLPFAWADGFVRALMLHADAWDRLFKSKRDNVMLFPILALSTDEDGVPFLEMPDAQDDWFADHADRIIPVCVAEIAAFWRGRGPRQMSMPLMPPRFSQSTQPGPKVGRNDPCPCGSGKKFKRCCGGAD